MTVLLLFSSPHSSSTGCRSEDTWHEIRDIPSSRITPDPLDTQLHDGASSLQFTSLIFSRVQVRGHLTRDQRHSFIQNHSRPFRYPAPWRCFFSSVHLTHLLQGAGQRTPDTRSETIPSSRITPDPLDTQLHDGASSLQFTSLIFSRVQVRGHLTRDQRHSFIQNHSRSFRYPDPWRCFFSSVHLTHLLQGAGQRTPDTRSETFLHPESLQTL